MNSSFDSTGVQFAWDSTSVKLAEECLYKYKLKMLDGWSEPSVSVHLRFGGIYATALEHYHKHVAYGMDTEDALRAVVAEAMVLTWDYEKDEDGNPIPETGQAWNPMHNTKTRDNLIRTIIWYIDHFANDELHVVKLADGTPAVEYSIALPVDDGIVFTCHLDRLVDYSDNLMVMDQKTTGATLSAAYFSAYSPDTQMSMYTFMGKTALKIPVKGVIIDAAQIAVGFSRFERGMTFRTDSQLNEWYNDTMYHIETAQHATREHYFPMNRSSCGNYGGCQFRKVCSKSPEHRLNFLKADFVLDERWDPLKRR